MTEVFILRRNVCYILCPYIFCVAFVGNRMPNLSKNYNINEMSAVFALYSRTYIINLVNVISFLLGNKDIRQIFFIYILYFCMQYLYYFLSYNLKCTEDDKQICFSKNVLRTNVIYSLLLFSMVFCSNKKRTFSFFVFST